MTPLPNHNPRFRNLAAGNALHSFQDSGPVLTDWGKRIVWSTILSGLVCIAAAALLH